MTTLSIRLHVDHSLVLVMDPTAGEVPQHVPDRLIAGGRRGIYVGCRLEDEGETTITLGAGCDVDPGTPPAFDNELLTPTGSVAILSITNDELLRMGGLAPTTRVRVWVNDDREPDDVTIGVG